jgi:hypothetical protein
MRRLYDLHCGAFGRRRLVTQIEFIELHAECITATATYFREAQKTSMMLRRSTREPLTFDERFALLSQEIVERDAFLTYLNAKRLLHSAALLGYGGISTN